LSTSSSSFTGNVLKLVSGSVIAQGLGILVAPIVTRLFAPEAFGVAALFVSIASIIGMVACLRYELSIMLPESDEEAANLLGLSLICVMIVTSISALIIFFAQDALINLFNVQSLRKYLWLIPVAVLLAGISMALNSWNSRTKHFGRLSIVRVISSFIMQTTKLTAGFAGYVSGGVLILTGILGSLISTLILGCQTWRDDSHLLKSSLQWKEIGFGIKRYKKFPLIDVWGGLLNVISLQMPVLLLSAFFTPAIVGFYALGAAVLRMPMNIVGSAIAQVFYQKASEEKNKGEVSEIAINTYKRLVALGLFPLFMLCIVGQDLFSVAFGHNWIEAGLYIQILAPWLFFTLISSPLSTLFLVFERQGSLFFMHSTIFLTRFISLYIGGILGNVHIALGLFSLTGVFVYGWLTYWNMKLAGISFYVFVAIPFKYFCYFCPVALSLLFIKYYFSISSIILLIVSGLMVCCYELIILSKDNDLRMYLKNNKIMNLIDGRVHL
jgi:lipopolysaccharide exporter